MKITEILTEGKYEFDKLPYSHTHLVPVLSQTNLKNHTKLAKAYADNYNSRGGKTPYNEAAIVLHNLFFEQFRSPRSSNPPIGDIKQFIEKHFKTWSDFKEEFEEEASKVQGSSWLYLSKSGKIKTIKNHQKKQDIVLLIDFWEHSYMLDYGSNKVKYLSNLWKIIDWEVIEKRLHHAVQV